MARQDPRHKAKSARDSPFNHHNLHTLSPFAIMNLPLKAALALLPAVAAALQLPSSGDQISRRSAVSRLIASSAATAATGAAPSILIPPGVANAADSISQATLNSKNKKAFPLASFGLQVYDDDTAYRLTLTALEVGYRNFFASVLAGNQKGFAKVRCAELLSICRLITSKLC